jgi:hypothetical protein
LSFTNKFVFSLKKKKIKIKESSVTNRFVTVVDQHLIEDDEEEIKVLMMMMFFSFFLLLLPLPDRVIDRYLSGIEREILL